VSETIKYNSPIDKFYKSFSNYKWIIIPLILLLLISPINGAVTKTTTTSGLYTIESYNGTGSTTWTPYVGVNNIEYLIVAGGGGGGMTRAGGGGAGGLLSGVTTNISNGVIYTIIVGNRGDGGPTHQSAGFNGQNSTFSNITAIGGGGGGVIGISGKNGGSGGGSYYTNSNIGLGTVGQGFNGGYGTNGGDWSGGGGGSSQLGYNQSTGAGGGNGTLSSITGTPKYYAGGGGGGRSFGPEASPGGSGGGGNGGGYSGIPPTNGTDGYGGGGGGGGVDQSAGGGSGIVIIKYLTPSSHIYKTTIIDGIHTVDIYTGYGSTVWTAPPYTTNIDFLIVGGGGSGGGTFISGVVGGGGGAGGYRYGADYSVTPGYPYNIIVGTGGTALIGGKGTSGGDSSIGIIISAGGGAGGSSDNQLGDNGGSGGGGAGGNYYGGFSTYSPLQGYKGGNSTITGLPPIYYPGAGGGGANESGKDSAAATSPAGYGGNGLYSSITGSSIAYAGGGGGGEGSYANGANRGIGGIGGGGDGGPYPGSFGAIRNGSNGTDGFGGGGGGASGGSTSYRGGNGGSGTVIIRYLTPVAPTPTTIPVPSLTSIPMPVQTYYNTTVYVDVVNSTYMQGWLYYLMVSNSTSIWDFPVIGFATSVMGPFADAFTGLGAGNLIYLILWGLFIMMVWRQSGKITIPAMIAVITAGAWSLLIPTSAQPWCSILLCAAIASQALTFFAKE